jgi:hypothetical protein
MILMLVKDNFEVQNCGKMNILKSGIKQCARFLTDMIDYDCIIFGMK